MRALRCVRRAGGVPMRNTVHMVGARRWLTDFTEQRFVDFEKRLDLDPRFRISMDEYVVEAQKFNITKGEAEEFCRHLSEKGEVFVFNMAGVNVVYLDARDITTALKQLLDPSGATVREVVAEKRDKLAKLSEELQGLDQLKTAVERRAEQSVHRMMWSLVSYMALQTIVVTRLTFWDLSWDVMEPICYINSFALTALGVYWFGFTKVDPAYRNVWDHFRNARTKKFARKYKLDMVRYNELQTQIARLEEDVALWREGSYRKVT